MKIEKISDSKIKLTVTGEDMLLHGISLESFVNDTPQMRSFFNTLIKKAEAETGFCAENSRLMIEAHPSDAGGVILFVTNLDREEVSSVKKPKIRAKAIETKKETSVFEFDSFDGICNFVKECTCYYRGGSVYSYRDKYYLITANSITPLVFEYASKLVKEPLFEAMLTEHGKCVIEKNAIDIIDQYFN